MPKLTSIALLLLTFSLPSFAGEVQVVPTHWEWCGWGGGGFFWAAAYHPKRPGVIYMGGDVAGCYKSEDDGLHWRMVNNGLIDYGVYGLAVDPSSPDTVYAITEAGTCKSTDAAEHWTDLPETHKGKLGILAERHVSVRPLAVDPSHSNVVYAATPHGVIYKSEDGAATWREVFTLASLKADASDALRLELPPGPPYYGGIFIPLTLPAETKPADCRGLGLSLKSNGVMPRTVHVSVWGPNHAVYLSKNLSDQMGNTQWQDISVPTGDFAVDPGAAKQHPAEAAGWPKQPDWSTVTRMDFSVSGTPQASVIELRNVYVTLADGRHSVLRDFATDKKVNSYGGFNTGAPKAAAFAGISVSRKDPRLVLAASPKAGLFASHDSGKTWESLDAAPKTARFAVADPN
ncbi:MAG TPA: hypothetical protein VLJ39_22290, partial [Tepidisphaeraceae bacterium]|nr:hypothetical protein [Tepidisphaeraceae bacterium]